MLNRCEFIGNLGADPEIKTFGNGGRIANLRLAVSESWKDRNTGERKEKTEWISVSLQSDGLVNLAEKYLRKGSKVYLAGKMQTRRWQDQSGNDRYSTEVVLQGFNGTLEMLDGKRDSDGVSSGQSSNDSYGGGGYNPLDDDIPFAPEFRV